MCAVVLSACSADARWQRLSGQSGAYILVTSDRGARCYTRVIDEQPLDQVCQRRDRLRYSQEPRVRNRLLEPLPAHVLALFATMGGELGIDEEPAETRVSFHDEP